MARHHLGSHGGGTWPNRTPLVSSDTVAEVGAALRAPRGTAKSASPRPQRWRAVDTVRLAKSELAAGEHLKSGTLRLTRLPPTDDAAAAFEPPTLHEGFYDFAANVVRPQPSARQHAVHLGGQFDERMQRLRGQQVQASPRSLGGSASVSSKPPLSGRRSGTDAPRKVPVTSNGPEDSEFSAESAEHSQREVQLCMDTLEQYARETSTESKERGAFFDKLRSEANGALTSLFKLVQRCLTDCAEAQAVRHGLEATVTGLEGENGDLRQVMQQMLAKEREHHAIETERTEETLALRKSLDQANERIAEISAQLEDGNAQVEQLLEEQNAARPTRDACNSPMMGFSSFVMAGDSPPVGQKTLKPEDAIVDRLRTSGVRPSHVSVGPSPLLEYVLPESLQSLGGGPAREELQAPAGRNTKVEGRRKSCSISGPSQQLQQQQGSILSVTPRRMSTNRQSTTSESPAPIDPKMRNRLGSQAAANAERSRSESPDAEAAYMRSRAGSRAVSTDPQQMGPTPDIASQCSSLPGFPEGLHSAALDVVGPSPVMAAFPALIPFLDFSTLDPELDRCHTEAIAVNQDHLEKHLVRLEEDYGRERARCEALQSSVDTCLERLLVWVQAVHDSLQDLSSNAVHADVMALRVVREAIEWLATHSCEAWHDPPGTLETVLDNHETRVRARLGEDRQADVEVEELQRALTREKSRVDELSEQLLEARSSAGGPSPKTKARGAAAVRRTSSMLNEPELRAVGVQCEILLEAASSPTPVAGGTFSSEAVLRSDDGEQDLVESAPGTAASMQDPIRGASRTPGDIRSDADAGTPASFSGSPGETGELLGPGEITADGADEAAGSPIASLAQGPSAVDTADFEAKKMRLLQSPFVESIDFTVVPAAGRVLLHPPAVDGGRGDGPESPKTAERLSPKQLIAAMSEIYKAKQADDAHRDKMHQPRRPLHIVMQEQIRRKHGVKSVAHNKSWQLVEAIMQHGTVDKGIELFWSFLDGSRDLDELSFHLYCVSVLTTGAAEASQALPPIRMAEGLIGMSRATHVLDLLFGDLPKALGVMKAELEKASRPAPVDLGDLMYACPSFDFMDPAVSAYMSSTCVAVADLHHILLEGWRMSALLLDRSVPGFSWRRAVLAFVQTDTQSRGWLDPHQATEAEASRLHVAAGDGAESLRLLEQMSLGAFVFRSAHRCSAKGANASEVGLAPETTLARPAAHKAVNPECLEVASCAFESLEPSLGVYLTWMTHSDELRDLSVCRSLRMQMYGYKQATGAKDAGLGVHGLRCMLLLLLAHQFDMSLGQQNLQPEYLDWELRCLLQVLRESWRRGAGADVGPAFGASLDMVGEQSR